jgi:hypothetical protein
MLKRLSKIEAYKKWAIKYRGTPRRAKTDLLPLTFKKTEIMPPKNKTSSLQRLIISRVFYSTTNSLSILTLWMALISFLHDCNQTLKTTTNLDLPQTSVTPHQLSFLALHLEPQNLTAAQTQACNRRNSNFAWPI